MTREIAYGIEFNIRTLGPLEAKLVLSLEERRITVIDVAGATSILGDSSQARTALLRLERKGWLERVSRGRYVLHPSSTGHLDARVISPLKYAGSIAPDTYVGWWAAAEHHGLTWQHPMLIRVATTRQLRARDFEDTHIEFVKVSRNKFFGFETARDGFAVSTVAKTVIDCIDKPKYAGGFAEAGIILGYSLDKITVDDLINVAIENGSTSTLQRLGFYLSTVRPKLFHADARDALLGQIGASNRSIMGGSTYSKGDFGYQSAWQLQVNLDKTAFLGEVDRFETGVNPRRRSN
jgi:predicted transcriptional regulator of viral defense system